MTPEGKIVKGFKATDANMQCRGFQFEFGKWFEHEGELEMCGAGFHFCPQPSGVWAYYSEEGTRVFEVEAEFVLEGSEPGADNKHVAKRIRFIREVDITGRRNTGHRNTGDRNTGDCNAGDFHSGSLCWGEAPFFLFNKRCKRSDVDFRLVDRLARRIVNDEPLTEEEIEAFLSLPNATSSRIKKLHTEHIKARKTK